MTWTDRIGRRIKLSDLHVFLTVAQTGSMARAATQLSVSNPVVSRAVAQLEHALGVRLMDRSPKGIRAHRIWPRIGASQSRRLRRAAARCKRH